MDYPGVPRQGSQGAMIINQGHAEILYFFPWTHCVEQINDLAVKGVREE